MAEKLAIKQFPRSSFDARTTAEQRYWRRFKSAVHIKEYASVASVSFSPVSPYDLAVTGSPRVQIYSLRSRSLKKTVSKFHGIVHCASFRADGKLIVAGDDSGSVQVVDASSRTLLRALKGHEAAIRGTQFLDNHVVSVSDDHTVRLWDIAEAKAIETYSTHDDYVRALSVSKQSPNLFVTGSYDHTVKLFDTRCAEPVMTFQHGGDKKGPEYPVESVLMLPSDTMIVSAGGPQMRVWDMIASRGRLVACSQNHQKTITSLATDGCGTRILSGSLDGHLKVYDLNDYQVTYTMKYPAPILSLAVSPTDSHLAVGMVNGLLSIRERKNATDETVSSTPEKRPYSIVAPPELPKTRHEQDMAARGGTLRFFLRGAHKPPSKTDTVIGAKKSTKLNQFEKDLLTFKYADALDNVLTYHPTTVLTVLEELKLRQDGLKIALSNRDDAALEPLLAFMVKYITMSRYTPTLLFVLEMVMDMYHHVLYTSPRIYTVFQKIRRKVRAEIDEQKDLETLMGVMDMVINFSEAVVTH